MIIKDRIYGKIEINHQLLIKIINSPTFQRLKNIHQDGAVHFIQPIRNATRFEHSIGVWYLSKLFQRPIEEQIAALLHDVSHTAFSHVIDFVVGDPNHEYADGKIVEFIKSSEIFEILSTNKIDIYDIFDKKKFPLLNNDLPNISFDRWDYFMRDGYMLGFLPKEVITLFLKNIFEKEETLYFKEKEIASLFSILYSTFSRLIWLDPTSHGSYFLLAKALKTAIEERIITSDDFFKDDEYVYTKLKKSTNLKIQNYLSRLSEGREFEYTTETEAEFIGPNKPRVVDPWVSIHGKLKRISTLVPSLSHFFSEFKKNYSLLKVRQI